MTKTYLNRRMRSYRWIPVPLIGLISALVLVGGALAAANVASQGGYRLGPNDVIRIQVFGEDDLTVESKVAGDGAINYPLLGSIRVAGKTVEELQDYLSAQLAGGYVRSPRVTVLVVRYRNFYVSGEVKTPGGFPYESGLTVQKAISIAGGFTEKAETRKVTMTRSIGDRTETVISGMDGTVFPDDILAVGHMQNFYVTGEVVRPGRYPYEEQLNIKKAITLAGGPTDKAAKGDLKVTRRVDGREEILPVAWETLVLSDDVIMVAEGQKVYVTGEVRTPGRFLFEPKMTVQRALTLAGGFTEKAETGSIKVTRFMETGTQTLVVPLETLVLPDDIILVEPQNHKFYVSGEVKSPGGFPYRDGLSVQKAIVMAGGSSEKADSKGLKVMRIVNGREESLSVTQDTAVSPEDTIIVPERQKFYVSGDVKTPGRYFYEPGVTVQKALTMAGGFTERADRTGIKVTRTKGSALETVLLDVDALVMPDDLIVVAQAKKFYVNGEVKQSGAFPFEKGLTVHKAITMAGGFTDKAAKSSTKVIRTINGEERSLEMSLEASVLPEDIIVVPQRFF